MPHFLVRNVHAAESAMPLKYESRWKFDGIGFEMPQLAASEFETLLLKVADSSWPILESFKAHFDQSSYSSSKDWALTDLHRAMTSQAKDAAAFMDSLWKCLEDAAGQGLAVPTVERINRVLSTHQVPLRVNGENLVEAVVDVVTASGADDVTSPVAPFELGEQIGSGGFGVVYKARRTTSVGTFEYAVKVLDPSPFLENHERAVNRFRREIRALSTLQHRSIIQCIEAGMTSAGSPYILMPLVVGSDLRTAASGVPLAQCLRMYLEILTGLEYAHSRDVVHRDLKPSNVLVRQSDRQPVILDFGAAYLMDEMDSRSLTTAALGTVGYIPSEVLAQPSLRTPLQDVYACGVMLYETLAGHRPDPNGYVPLADSRPECASVDPIVRAAVAGYSARVDANQMVALLAQAIEAVERAGAG